MGTHVHEPAGRHHSGEHGAHGEHATHGGPELRPVPERHAGHDINLLWKRFWVVLILTVPVLVYSKGIQDLLHFTPPAFPGSEYLPAVISVFVYLYGGTFFLKGALGELRALQPGMMTLVALGISVAFIYSLAVTLGLPGQPFYWELTTLIAVMLLGHWVEMRAIGSARGALRELAKLMPDEAERVTDGTTEVVPIADLQAGDLVLVRPGAKVPADGEVVDGRSSVNEAMVTGESRPVPKGPGDGVIAGTVNGDGSLRVRVAKVGEETALAGIMRLVAEAQASRSMAQNMADRAASWLTAVAIGAGAVTLGVWSVSRVPESFALERTVTVFVIACPHALGLAIPLVIAISTTLAARNGILVRDRMALEAARNLNVVAFDKTGTLTAGEYGVAGVYPASGADEAECLALAAAAERDSEHLLARAIVRSAEKRGVRTPAARDFKAIPGQGVEARVDGRSVKVGGPRLLEALGAAVPREVATAADRARAAGQTVVYVVVDGEVRAALALADVMRPESREAVQTLREMGVQVAMLTGDSEEVARQVASDLGIEEYQANVQPGDKAEWVREARREGRRVAMVGDGVNDAPALAAADVGIAIGAGTDVAVEAGGVVLVRNDPRDVASVIRLSRASYGKMAQNLLWATGYNVVAIPLAAGILASYGIILPPAVGAALMSISTVIVAANAQLLRRLNLQTT